MRVYLAIYMYLTMALPVNDTGPVYSAVGPELLISSCYDYQCLFMSATGCIMEVNIVVMA